MTHSLSARHFVGTALAVHRHRRAGRAELKAYQDARLRSLLVHAYERVPYYRRLFDRHRLHPRHIRGTIDLDLIPVTAKQDLSDRAVSDIVAEGLDPARLAVVRTNGSTGEPFAVRRTKLEQSFHTLFRYRWRRELGLKLHERIATVRLLSPEGLQPKLGSRVMEAFGIHPTIRIDGMQEPAAIVQQLMEFEPQMVVGPPGMLCRVAEHLLASGMEDIRPRLLVSGGEVLTPVMRRRLTEAFGVVPTETYASHECPFMGWECAVTGEIHTCDDACIVEVLRDGRPAKPGEEGEVVVTNLHAYAMPFIRYRLADVAIRGSEQCRCGQPFSTVRALRGRMIDYFPLADGRVLHPYNILDRFMPEAEPWIRQYQMVQEQPNKIVLELVPKRPVGPRFQEQIERSASHLLGPDIDFQVRLVSEIPLGPGGKFRHSRSLVASPWPS
jgi:phenylacetate-CoA ligase